jgi:hypothetical protein
VEITAALAADLAILSEALVETDADILEAFRQLAMDVKVAVRSYLGLAVIARNSTFPLTLTAMEPLTHRDDVVSSLLMPLWDQDLEGHDPQLVVILYAGRAGAFVDLAADLSWLSGRPLSDFTLDQHLSLPEPDSQIDVRGSSVVNQAIGVLIGRGYTPAQAALEIDARAAAAGESRVDAAALILGDALAGDGDAGYAV